MTKKDYIIIAKAIKQTDKDMDNISINNTAHDFRSLLINNLCDTFKDDNTKFIRQVFRDSLR